MTSFEFSGSRISGYTGHRRRESIDYSTGRTASGKVPSAVRQALARDGEDLKAAFMYHDADGSGELDPKEFREIFTLAGAPVSIPDIESLFNMMDTSGSGLISYTDFVDYLGQDDNKYEEGHRKRDFAGSRPSGYSGHRRKQSYYDSVGKASSNQVSTAVKQIVFDKAGSITDLFIRLDTNGDGVLSQEELREGFTEMKIGLNISQIDAIYDQILKPSLDGVVRLKQLTEWLDGVDYVSVTLPQMPISPGMRTRNLTVPESNTASWKPKNGVLSTQSQQDSLGSEINELSQSVSHTSLASIRAGTSSRSPKKTTSILPRYGHASGQYRREHTGLKLA